MTPRDKRSEVQLNGPLPIRLGEQKVRGAVLYATKYGSTAEYAAWIGEGAELPVFNVGKERVDLNRFDFLILASPVIYYKLLITDWVQENLTELEGKRIMMVTVSGAPPGPKLNAWVGDSLPAEFLAKVKHVGLRGRQVRGTLSWFDRAMLTIAAWKNPDPVASREERYGFDYMDRASITPVVAFARECSYTSNESSEQQSQQRQ